MKPLVGGLIGALVAGSGVLAWHARTTADPAAWTAAPALVRPVPAAATSDPGATPVSVRCEPGQRAVLRSVEGPAGRETEAGCVDDAAMAGLTARSFVPQPMLPVAQTVAYDVPQARVVPVRTVYRERTVYRARSRRDWKKTALVIGGSSGAGAGIGALAGGRKGALIGAAIGGGAATIYELTHKR